MSTVELDPGARAFLELTAGTPPLDEVPVAQSRADLARVVALTGEPRPLPEVLDSTVPGPAGEVPVWVYRPSPERALPVTASSTVAVGCSAVSTLTTRPAWSGGGQLDRSRFR